MPKRIAAFSLFCLASAVNGEDRIPAALDSFVSEFCLECHDSGSEKGDLNLEAVLDGRFSAHADSWENVVRRLSARQMPPKDERRPDEEGYQTAQAELEALLDKLPVNPGRTPTFRRLTRVEYKNAIRDLLALEIDSSRWLPKDEAGHGFDNITVGDLSPTLLNRYVAAAQEISRMAVGRTDGAEGRTIRIRPDITQEAHREGLPFGTRGGALVEHTFPQNGEYEIEVRLARDRNEHVEGLRGAQQLEILLDRKPVGSIPIGRPDGSDHSKVDANLKLRLPVAAGPRKLGITFRYSSRSVLETKRQPYEARYNFHRHPRQTPAVFQISITGPFGSGELTQTPSRERIFGRGDESKSSEARAREILSRLIRRAYRRPVVEEDLLRPMQLFKEVERDEGFEAGIEMALSAVLVSSNFLMRVEKEPERKPEEDFYAVNDIELASRLSFFLWSSIPDERLLVLAERQKLSDPSTLRDEVQRMLADEKADSLVSNFASQWLHLRNLESLVPDGRLFPDFDDNLRQAMRMETELLFKSVLEDNRPVVDLLDPGYTFVNERLAKHYGIPHIYGDRFRRVIPGTSSHRGGLLRHASILTVTSYANRTSPVLRGNWILDNIVGTPPPPPPPDVPPLEDNTVSAKLSVRERLAEHRENKQCAVCHDIMDPVGLALENFDAVGRWRDLEDERPIDVTGGLPDGREVTGIDGLEEGLLERPDLFAKALTEKLMTYALGRGLEAHDAPAVRKVVRDAEADEYRISSIISGIVSSKSFTMRTWED